MASRRGRSTKKGSGWLAPAESREAGRWKAAGEKAEAERGEMQSNKAMSMRLWVIEVRKIGLEAGG
jgi:hypothetical protein